MNFRASSGGPTRPRESLIGIPWVQQEEYDAFLAILEDADQLPKAWDRYAARMEKVEQSLKEDGFAVARVDLNPGLFKVWCEREGFRIDIDASHKFAARITVNEQRKAGGGW